MDAQAAPVEPTLAELAAVARDYVRPNQALMARARAGREAISFGADPALTLALVVWPNEKVTAAQTSMRGET